MHQTVRDQIVTWFHEGLAAVDPTHVTRQALTDLELGEGKIIVLAIGKAAIAMARAANEVLGDRIDAGLIVAKQGQITEDLDRFTEIEAGHPVPNLQSLRAGELALEMVQNLSARDTVIALISGGGSALLESPIEDISLMDLQVMTELLMYAGAGIHDLNSSRKALSAIKGGGLRRAMGDARCITLLLSDVIGNDPTVIASGPTIVAPTSRKQAWQVIFDFDLQDRVPESVRQALTTEAPVTEPFDASRDKFHIVADNDLLIDTIYAAAKRDGYQVDRVLHEWRYDARDLAEEMVRATRETQRDVLIGGGEATSLVRGNGRGGRNTEMALVAAMQMGDDDWTIASLASDGDDGNSGAAGAIVNRVTVADVSAAQAALANSDSAGYLESTDSLVVTGQTGTNVNDVYIAVRNSSFTGDSM